jgi:hypothetical protein
MRTQNHRCSGIQEVFQGGKSRAHSGQIRRLQRFGIKRDIKINPHQDPRPGEFQKIRRFDHAMNENS